MLTFNSVTALGYLGKAPQLYDSGVCRFSICTSEKWTDKNGKERESKKWFSCVCFSGVAKWAASELRKGEPVLIVGKMQDREWTDEETGEVKYGHEVLCKTVVGLSPQGRRKASDTTPPMDEEVYDDVPF